MSDLPDFYVPHVKGHKWGLCGFCGIMVICGTCGNNGCNGGSGWVSGKSCPDCDSAYEYQREFMDEAETFYAPYEKEMRDKQRKMEDVP